MAFFYFKLFFVSDTNPAPSRVNGLGSQDPISAEVEVFGIETPIQFYAKLVQEFDDAHDQPGSSRHAMNFAITAHHMTEWVWRGLPPTCGLPRSAFPNREQHECRH